MYTRDVDPTHLLHRTARRAARLSAVAVLTAGGVAALGSAAFAADETPASVAFSDTCAGIHAVFTSADQHTTEFDVTTTDGGSQVITGSGSGDFAADAAHPDLSVAYDGTTAGWTWTDPGNCAAPTGSAEPTIDASKECATGITVVLGNLNGSADATFSVTGVDGSTETVPVRVGEIKKLSYPVVEDTTGVVSVKTAGLSKTVTYAKDCATVQGVKHVKGENAGTGGSDATQGGGGTEATAALPRTGFEWQPTALLGLMLLASGALLCRLGSRPAVR